MKKIIFTALALVALALPIKAQNTVARTNVPPSITVAWTPPSDPSVTGYNLYLGGVSGTYTNVTAISGVATAQFTVLNVVRGGTYFLTITSVSATTGLESLYSNEVTTTVPNLPTPPVMGAPKGH